MMTEKIDHLTWSSASVIYVKAGDLSYSATEIDTCHFNITLLIIY